MADRDDRDTSLGGGSSGGSNVNDARSDTPSSGRAGGGVSGGYGGSPGGGSSPGYGWGGGAGTARNDTPSSGRSTGSNLGGGGYGSSPGGNVNSARADTPSYGRSPGSSPTGFSSAVGGRTATTPTRASDQSLPDRFDLGRLGTNPNINPDRFNDWPTDQQPPTSMAGRMPTGYAGTYWAGGRFGPSVPAPTGMTQYEHLKNREKQLSDPIERAYPREMIEKDLPRNFQREVQRQMWETEQSPAMTDYGKYYDPFGAQNTDPYQGMKGLRNAADTTGMTERAALGTTNPATGLPSRANAPGTSWAGTERAPAPAAADYRETPTNPGGAHAIERGQDFSLGRSPPTVNAPAAPTATGYNPSTGIAGATIDPNQFSNPSLYGSTARTAEIQSMRDLANMNVPGTSMAGTETALDLPTQAETAAATPTAYPSTMGGVPLGGQPTPAAGPTGFGAAIANPTGPVTPAGVTPAAITDVPVTGPPSLADVPLADFRLEPGEKIPTTDVVDRVRAAVRSVMGPDWEVFGVSGLRAKGGAHRHPEGKALDFQTRNTKTGQVLDYHNPADAAKMREIAEVGMRDFGIQGVGVGSNYMSGTSSHLDITKNLNSNQAKQWKDAKNYTQTWDAARAAYNAAGNTPAPQQPVASMMASASETTPQMAALNDLNQTTATASTNAVTSSPVDAAGRTTSATLPGTGGFPATPTGSVQPEGGAPTPTAAPRGTEAAAGKTVTTAAPATFGFPPTPSAQPQATGFPSFATPATDYQRTGLATALGLGIDAIASIAGGPVSLAAQGGAFLLTGDSIGGTIVDMAGGKYGPNQYAPGADDKYSGDRAGGAGSGKQNTTGVNKPETISKTPTVKPGETTTDETKLPYEEAFVAKYIDRPSAAERWGKLTKVSDYVT